MEAERLTRDLKWCRKAAPALARCPDDRVRALIHDIADRTLQASDQILAANQLDLERMEESDPKYDRLLLNPERIEGIVAELRNVADLPSPVGEVLEQRTLDNGLQLSKVRVPIGVIAVIYESRPNVTFDVAALCLRSLNACVLKGSSDAYDSNLAIVRVIHESLTAFDLDPALVLLTPPERRFLPQILQATDFIDMAIPRGSRGLIDFVRDNARIPVIETGAGIVHTYVDRSADLDKAQAIITNAKSRRVSVCNALDTLLLHRDLLSELPGMLHELGTSFDVRVYADEAAYEVLEGNYPARLKPAKKKHFGREFLDYRMSVRTVDGLEQALKHIDKYSSKHSEAIVAEDPETIGAFLQSVDAATVYANASTAFTDGAQFGMGAEIGISTQKLHARGPMALPELTSYKWLVRGDGQTRP
jgi:glutamate-5-semialdehyde dehydrogenase